MSSPEKPQPRRSVWSWANDTLKYFAPQLSARERRAYIQEHGAEGTLEYGKVWADYQTMTGKAEDGK